MKHSVDKYRKISFCNLCILIYQVVYCCTKVCNLHLISAPLKGATIEYFEQDVTCLNEKVFIENMYHLLTNCSQSLLPAMVCTLTKPIGFKYKLSNVWRIVLCSPMKALLNQECLNQCAITTRGGRQPVIDWNDFSGIWLWLHFYRELIPGGITHCKSSDTTWELRM